MPFASVITLPLGAVGPDSKRYTRDLDGDGEIDLGTGEWLRDRFGRYTTLTQAVNVGGWTGQDAQGNVAHSIATTTGPEGNSVKCYQTIWRENEARCRLEFMLPGAVPGDASTGKTRVNVQWKERNFGTNPTDQFDYFGCSAKALRIVGLQSNLNATLDNFLGFGDFLSPGTFQLGITGQALGNTSDFFYVNAPVPGPTEWVCYEFEGQLNTVSQSDGYWRLYRNGVVLGQATARNIRGGSNNYAWHRIDLGGWDSGSDYPKDRTRQIYDVVIADHYIGV